MRGIVMWIIAIGPLVYALDRVRRHIDWTVVQNLLASKNLTSMIGAFGQIKDLEDVRGTVLFALIWSAFFGVVLFPAFGAIMVRWWLNGIRLGGATIASDLPMRRFYGAYLRYLWYVLVFSIAFSVAAGIEALIVVGVLSSVVDFSVTSTPRDAILVMLGIAIYVIYILGCSTIFQVVVRLRIWQLAVESVVLSGLAALDNVQARPAHSSAVGEGLADALGTGNF